MKGLESTYDHDLWGILFFYVFGKKPYFYETQAITISNSLTVTFSYVMYYLMIETFWYLLYRKYFTC